MLQLVDDSKDENIRTSISDSDADSDSKWKNDTKAAYTLTSVEPSPSTPLFGTSKQPKLGQYSNIALTSPAIAAGGRSESLEAPDPVSKNFSPSRVRGPSFESYDQGKLPVTKITNNVFNLLLKDLGMSKDPNQGYIYALSMEGYKGYVKIGYTKRSIATRVTDIQRCVPYKLDVFNKNDYHLVPNYERVEELIHEELRKERRQFPCTVCPLNKIATGTGCPKMHDEWFEISEAKASEVVDKWRKWMWSDPYCQGQLRPTERLKIAYYRRCATQLPCVDFVKFPRWKLPCIWLYEELHKSRPQKPNCSRWDSLCKHWMSNLVFCLGTLIFSHTLFVVSAMLPPAFISIRYLTLANSIFLGGFALLYAA
ncbi:hypothetical protein JMJ35_009461 [Cladonia borealis]|uniref:Bacteriophage T5 Orf172 DNA-binding domain-containing protein n=1 Tax=Cladonia borealis TaxID=184061 RepID=A0AA39UYC4_9LECA|nr:hypothetical protein JMJ35_009461 [Cladonia borealis]